MPFWSGTETSFGSKDTRIDSGNASQLRHDKTVEVVLCLDKLVKLRGCATGSVDEALLLVSIQLGIDVGNDGRCKLGVSITLPLHTRAL